MISAVAAAVVVVVLVVVLAAGSWLLTTGCLLPAYSWLAGSWTGKYSAVPLLPLRAPPCFGRGRRIMISDSIFGGPIARRIPRDLLSDWLLSVTEHRADVLQ